MWMCVECYWFQKKHELFDNFLMSVPFTISKHEYIHKRSAQFHLGLWMICRRFPHWQTIWTLLNLKSVHLPKSMVSIHHWLTDVSRCTCTKRSEITIKCLNQLKKTIHIEIVIYSKLKLYLKTMLWISRIISVCWYKCTVLNIPDVRHVILSCVYTTIEFRMRVSFALECIRSPDVRKFSDK